MPKHRSIVAPVILILLGLAFLAENLGLLDGNLWMALWRLWPIWLIAAGLDLLVGRRYAWGSWAVLGAVLLLVGGAYWYDLTFQPAGRMGEPVTISQPLEGQKQAEIRIDSSVAELSVVAHGSTNLVEGTVYPLAYERVEQEASQSGDTLHFRLRTRGRGGVMPVAVPSRPSTWELRLSDQVPVRLQVDTGVGESRIDLSGLQLTHLDLDTGVGETVLTLPARGRFDAQVDSGVGTVTLRIPKELAAQIRVDTGLGGITVRGDFERNGKTLLTRGQADAQNWAEIEIDGGVGEIIIEQL